MKNALGVAIILAFSMVAVLVVAWMVYGFASWLAGLS